MPTQPVEFVKRHAASGLTVIMLCAAVIVVCLAAWSFFPYSDTVWFCALLTCFAASGLSGIIAAFQGKRWALVISILDFAAVAGMLLIIRNPPAV
jgi:hypothetical protein